MGYIYVRRSGDSNLFKIGRTTDVERRGKQLATGNPEPLVLFETIESERPAQCETFLKAQLRLRRSRRSDAKEFYECEVDELLAAIEMTRVYAREVLARTSEVERLARKRSDGRVIDPGARERELFEQLLAARKAEDEARYERERCELELKLAIGTASTLRGLARWKTEFVRDLDREALKKEEPEIFERFLREKPRRTFHLL